MEKESFLGSSSERRCGQSVRSAAGPMFNILSEVHVISTLRERERERPSEREPERESERMRERERTGAGESRLDTCWSQWERDGARRGGRKRDRHDRGGGEKPFGLGESRERK